jgi:thiol-disulfide isomerase/thioredoxin
MTGSIAFLLVLATLCALVFWFVIHSREMQALTSPSQVPKGFTTFLGDQMPHFSVTSFSGTTYDTQKLARPLLIEILAPWCPHCRKMVPVMNRLAGRNDIGVVGISAGTPTEESKVGSPVFVVAFKKQFHVRYDLAYDPKNAIERKLKIVGFPSLYLLDGSGKVVFNTFGEFSEDSVQKAISEIHRR